MHMDHEMFTHDCTAIIQVGEDAGTLAPALQKAASEGARSRVSRHVAFISRIKQPLLLIILGLMITLLILASLYAHIDHFMGDCLMIIQLYA